MIDDSSVASDLESLRIAARTIQLQDNDSQKKNQTGNRNDIVHAGYRILQCVAAAIIFAFHITARATLGLPDGWNFTYVTIYPICFTTSLILAITRMMNVIPNPKPIIPVTISLAGWSAMLTGGILAMRHSAVHIDVGSMTDDEIAASPVFRHDLTICALSLVGSSLYLVHAWLCYDCWWWEKREMKLREAREPSQTSTSGAAESTSEVGTPPSEKEAKHESDSSIAELPSTSDRQSISPENGSKKSKRASKLLKKLRGTSETKSDETDPFVTLTEIMRRSIEIQQTVSYDPPIQILVRCHNGSYC